MRRTSIDSPTRRRRCLYVSSLNSLAAQYELLVSIARPIYLHRKVDE